jgi:hypothetical protein
MNNQYNWQQIKQALKENFIEPYFKQYSTTAFTGVDFDKGLEIFRYILEKELQNHDKSKGVFEALQFHTDKTNFEKVLDNLSSKYEPFTKKIFEILNIQYIPNGNNSMPPALSWCYKKLFNKQPSTIPSQRIRDFKAFTLNGKISNPNFPSDNFETNFLTDNTNFGKDLHKAYHFRNSETHNDPKVNTNDTLDYVKGYITCYLYFTFKYYTELIALISPDDLIPPATVTIINVAYLSGGAYNPEIENEVKRDNIIQTIEKKLEGLDVLFIEGEEGIGKTTILHQFIAKHPTNCFAYFIDGKDSNTYSNLSILKALCNQVCFVNSGNELEEKVSVDIYNNEDWLKSYLGSQSITNKNHQTFYFIMDGLDEVNQDKQNEIKELILDNWKYYKTNFKLLLSGKQNKNLIKEGLTFDKFDITLLSESESYAIFGDITTKEQFNDINKVCQKRRNKY